jgi:hypothetical protein
MLGRKGLSRGHSSTMALARRALYVSGAESIAVSAEDSGRGKVLWLLWEFFLIV